MICPLAPAIVQSFNRAQLFILAAGLGEKRQPLSGVALDAAAKIPSISFHRLGVVMSVLAKFSTQKSFRTFPVARDPVRGNAQHRGRLFLQSD